MKTSLLSGFFEEFKKINLIQTFYLLIVLFLSFVASKLFLEYKYYQERIYPNTYINSIDVSGLTIVEAVEKLSVESEELEEKPLSIFVDDIKISSSSSELGLHHNYLDAVNTAFEANKSDSFLQSIYGYIQTNFVQTKITSEVEFEFGPLHQMISELENMVNIEGEEPYVSLGYSGNADSISVFEGEPGRAVNSIDTKSKIKQSINQGEFEVNVTIASTSSVLSQEQIDQEVIRAEKFVGKSLSFRADDKRFELEDTDLISLLTPQDGFQEKQINRIVDSWGDEVNREAQNAEFKYNQETLDVEVFVPHKDGLEINKDDTKDKILEWLMNVDNSKISDDEAGVGAGAEGQDGEAQSVENQEIEILLERTSPEVTLESTNDLGIKERIGFGESYYHHSIINRVHNVGITAERISLTIVPPGEEFSFNKTLGEVSARTGYRSAYVISGGKTVLGDGGGVCQVSSTMFRSVLDAGLKVTKRLQHSYRVSYYELNSDPGFDATVYSGNIDFRFVNDTDHHILLFSNVDEENRYMNIEIYGTSDGRTTEISGYKKWDYRPPPAPEYYPTTELAPGVVRQVDWAVSGIKAEFTHTIRDADGNTTSEDVYYSNYRPWSAKYMKGI